MVAKDRISAEPAPVPRTQRVNAFTYLDYRALLHALYADKKASEYGFSHRAFARRAGFKSTNYLKLVMDGARNLSPDAAARFAHAFGLQGHEADYFCELVAYNQATSARARSQAYERMVKLKPRDVRELDERQGAYYATWYLPAIRELATRDDFRDDPVRATWTATHSAAAKRASADSAQLG
jgi:uncharacterized protein (TIGR02147 family)